MSRVRSPTCLTCVLGLAAGDPASCPLVRLSRPAGTRLFRSGDRVEVVYLVISGEVLLTREDAEGGSRPEGLRGAGALLGIEALGGEPIYGATAHCLVPTEICTLACSRLEAWMGSSTSVGRAFARLAALEARELARSGDEAGPCAVRVAGFLLARHRLGRAAPLQKQVLAGLLRMRPETLSRCVARLSAQGAIDEGSLAVLDAELLEALLNPG